MKKGWVYPEIREVRGVYLEFSLKRIPAPSPVPGPNKFSLLSQTLLFDKDRINFELESQEPVEELRLWIGAVIKFVNRQANPFTSPSPSTKTASTANSKNTTHSNNKPVDSIWKFRSLSRNCVFGLMRVSSSSSNFIEMVNVGGHTNTILLKYGGVKQSFNSIESCNWSNIGCHP